MEEASWRKHRGGGIREEGIKEKASGRRHHGGGIMGEASWRRHHGGGIMEEASCETSGRRQGEIMEEASTLGFPPEPTSFQS